MKKTQWNPHAPLRIEVIFPEDEKLSTSKFALYGFGGYLDTIKSKSAAHLSIFRKNNKRLFKT